MSGKFIRTKEDFICSHCGAEVIGNGYTNHCPKCLWSRHVDVNPGDRAEECGGMMEPIRTEYEHGKFILIHKCEKCGKERRVKMNDSDDMEVAAMLNKKSGN
jgi:Zn finger protein HypA/HybF involved in hydrogenase expression